MILTFCVRLCGYLSVCADKVAFDYANTVRLTLQVVSGVGLDKEILEPWGECVERCKQT